MAPSLIRAAQPRSSAMRTSERLIAIVVVGLGIGCAPAFGFDGKSQPSDVAPAVSVDVVPRRAAAPVAAAPLAVAPNPALPAPPTVPLSTSLGLGSIGEEPVC